MVEQDAAVLAVLDGVERADGGAGGAGIGGDHLEHVAADRLEAVVGLEVEHRGAADGDRAADRELVVAGGVVAGTVGAADLDLQGTRVDRVVAEDGQDVGRVARGDKAAGLGEVAADRAGTAQAGAARDGEVLAEGIRLVVVDGAVDDHVGVAVGDIVAVVHGARDEGEGGAIARGDIAVHHAREGDGGIVKGFDVAVEGAGGGALAVGAVDGDAGLPGGGDVAVQDAAGGHHEGGVGRLVIESVEADVAVEGAGDRDGDLGVLDGLLDEDGRVDHAAGENLHGGLVVGVDAVGAGEGAGDGELGGLVQINLGGVELDRAARLHVDDGGIVDVEAVGVGITALAIGRDVGEGGAGLDVQRGGGEEVLVIVAELQTRIVEVTDQGDVAEEVERALVDVEVLVEVRAAELRGADAILDELGVEGILEGRLGAEDDELAGVDGGGVEVVREGG